MIIRVVDLHAGVKLLPKDVECSLMNGTIIMGASDDHFDSLERLSLEPLSCHARILFPPQKNVK